MRGELQQRINPPTSRGGMDFNTGLGKVSPEKPATNDVDFLKVLNNSNKDTKLEREAKKNGDLSGAKNYQDFLKNLEASTKKLREPKNNLDKDDFLKLFVTQLKHQDPLNPNDSTEMASKLAHFNSLEQMLNVNKTLTKMLDTQKENRSVDLVNYVGKEININGGRVRLKDGVATESMYDVKRPATAAKIEVRDAAGVVVMTKDLGSLDAGEHKFKWDGKDAEGNKIANGFYSFAVIAQDIDERDVEVQHSSKTKISGIDIQDKDGGLFTELGKVKLSDIKSIGVDGFVKDDKSAEAAQELTEKAEAAKAKTKDNKPKIGIEQHQLNNPVQPNVAASGPATVEAPPVKKQQASVTPVTDKGMPNEVRSSPGHATGSSGPMGS